MPVTGEFTQVPAWPRRRVLSVAEKRRRRRRCAARATLVLAVAAVAVWAYLPRFDDGMGHSRNSAAKTDARNTVSMVEACFEDLGDYRECTGAAGLGSRTGITFGSAIGQVYVVAHSKRAYTISAHAMSGNTYSITKMSDGNVDRWCEASGTEGCPAGGKW